jgi:hypothetical protein
VQDRGTLTQLGPDRDRILIGPGEATEDAAHAS